MVKYNLKVKSPIRIILHDLCEITRLLSFSLYKLIFSRSVRDVASFS